MLSLSEKYLLSQRSLKKLYFLYCEKEEEIPTLREMIAELEKGRELYIPVNGDLIDNYLANYINSKSTKLPVPFVRLYHGMYLFGSKKVIIRIENSGIVSNFYIVRLGGGYSNIDDFIRNNTEIELEKCKDKKKMQELNVDEKELSPETKMSRALDRKITVAYNNEILAKENTLRQKDFLKERKRRDTVV